MLLLIVKGDQPIGLSSTHIASIAFNRYQAGVGRVGMMRYLIIQGVNVQNIMLYDYPVVTPPGVPKVVNCLDGESRRVSHLILEIPLFAAKTTGKNSSECNL